MVLLDGWGYKMPRPLPAPEDTALLIGPRFNSFLRLHPAVAPASSAQMFHLGSTPLGHMMTRPLPAPPPPNPTLHPATTFTANQTADSPAKLKPSNRERREAAAGRQLTGLQRRLCVCVCVLMWNCVCVCSVHLLLRVCRRRRDERRSERQRGEKERQERKDALG